MWGDDRFGAEGGEDLLFSREELAIKAVSSILRDSDLKKVEALCVEEALALSLQGTISMSEGLLLYVSSSC